MRSNEVKGKERRGGIEDYGKEMRGAQRVVGVLPPHNPLRPFRHLKASGYESDRGRLPRFVYPPRVIKNHVHIDIGCLISEADSTVNDPYPKRSLEFAQFYFR